MTDPATLEQYNLLCLQNTKVTGFGFETKTILPCPGCAAAGWMEFPVTAGLNDYVDIQEPKTCAECGRTFKFVVVQGDDGSTQSTFVQTGGAPIPFYLPPIRYERES